ncbi:Small GTPase Cdc42 [Mycena venus]|uniref:Small GTPase Cdc42 n=1 Tax=Mycena venus TaxID=2733690 RepID=A0A8H6YKV6_9AGAR|nr:Small GTPase Cdc42 [Mycena venus]
MSSRTNDVFITLSPPFDKLVESTPARSKNDKKLIILGDGGVGKTSMLFTYSTKTFQSELQYSMFDHGFVPGKVEEETYKLWLFDTGGGEDYDRLRPLSYPETDVFLICFRVTQRKSFENIWDKWIPEVRHHCPDVPFLIIATQIDLRNDSSVVKILARQKQQLVTTREGERLARELGAAKYLECSALTQKGLDSVFDEALKASLSKWPVDLPRLKRRVKSLSGLTHNLITSGHIRHLSLPFFGSMNSIKLVVVGDDAVGKTSLMISHTRPKHKFPTDYVPTVFDAWAEEVMVGPDAYVLGFFDTVGLSVCGDVLFHLVLVSDGLL